MQAKPTGRPPCREKARTPRPRAAKVKIPRDLTAGQRRHVREIAAGATNQSLLDEYSQALRLRDECAALIEKEGATVKTERGAMKAHPAAQMLKDSNVQMLNIRRLIERPKESQPATPAASGNEARIQEFLDSDDLMPWLIDDQGNDVAGDSSWRNDRRVIEHLRRLEQKPH